MENTFYAPLTVLILCVIPVLGQLVAYERFDHPNGELKS